MENKATYSKSKIGWMIFAIVFCGLVQGFGTFKLIPMQDAIQNYFNIDAGAYGILASAQNWMMIAFSVPMGYLIRKIPSKWSMSIGYCLAILGVILQITTKSFPVFVAGRLIEGGGFGFVQLGNGSLILNLVEENRKSFWSCVMVVTTVLPQVVTTKVGSVLVINTGLSFQNVFALIGGLQVLALIIWIIIIPVSLRAYGVESSVKPTKEQTRRVYRNPDVWLTSLAFISFNAATIVFANYVVKLMTWKGMDPGEAASTYSYAAVIGVAAMLFFGWLSDKLHTKKKIVIASLFTCAVSFILLRYLPNGLMWIYVIVFGISRSVTGLTNGAAADLAEVPSDVPIVSSVRNTIMQLGSVVMGIVLGFVIQYAGYTCAVFIIIAELIVSIVLWLFVKRVK
ncbi:MAG: MFS transporter [Lachnospiraceae bacterium]|nr:MFS transporter [Lachnospiraceae bacterium]